MRHCLSPTSKIVSENENIWTMLRTTPEGMDMHGVFIKFSIKSRCSLSWWPGIVGIGILSLPAGIAAGTGILSGMLVLLTMYVAPWDRNIDLTQLGLVFLVFISHCV